MKPHIQIVNYRSNQEESLVVAGSDFHYISCSLKGSELGPVFLSVVIPNLKALQDLQKLLKCMAPAMSEKPSPKWCTCKNRKFIYKDKGDNYLCSECDLPDPIMEDK